jgi:catechol 2,3-dioxygenase
MEGSLSFYRDLLGFRVAERSDSVALLCAPGAGSDLVRLTEKVGISRQPVHAAGLYHTAFLLPSRGDLGLALRRLGQEKWPLQGGSDHGVSEALYLADPDGNGIELYADRPRSEWPLHDGEIAMTTRALDVRGLLAAADDRASEAGSWNGMPEGTTVGHIHLRVSSIEEGRRLFVDVIGLDVTSARYPGALFMSAGGYHHHVAINVWDGAGASPLPESAAGLLDFELIVPDAAAISAIVDRARSAGVLREQGEGEQPVLEYAGGIRVRIPNPGSDS